MQIVEKLFTFTPANFLFFLHLFFFFFDSCYKNAKKPDIKMSKKHNLKFCTCFIHKKQTLKIKRSFFVFLRPYEVFEQVFVCARVLCVDLRASATVHGSDEHHSQSVRAFLRVLILYSFSLRFLHSREGERAWAPQRPWLEGRRISGGLWRALVLGLAGQCGAERCFDKLKRRDRQRKWDSLVKRPVEPSLLSKKGSDGHSCQAQCCQSKHFR